MVVCFYDLRHATYFYEPRHNSDEFYNKKEFTACRVALYTVIHSLTEHKMKYLAVAAVLGALLFTGCASSELIDPCVDPEQSEGFLMGLIQGFIAPLAFIVSLFDDHVAMYAVNNGGWLYDLGFLIGIGGFSGGILKGRRGSRRD